MFQVARLLVNKLQQAEAPAVPVLRAVAEIAAATVAMAAILQRLHLAPRLEGKVPRLDLVPRRLLEPQAAGPEQTVEQMPAMVEMEQQQRLMRLMTVQPHHPVLLPQQQLLADMVGSRRTPAHSGPEEILKVVLVHTRMFLMLDLEGLRLLHLSYSEMKWVDLISTSFRGKGYPTNEQNVQIVHLTILQLQGTQLSK
jgi:hypothetical protein